MTVYTYSKANKNLSLVLEEAIKKGEVKIKSQNGQVFVIKPKQNTDSPLDVKGINLGITTNEIIQSIHESRRMK